jgi:hypothetical protein
VVLCLPAADCLVGTTVDCSWVAHGALFMVEVEKMSEYEDFDEWFSGWRRENPSSGMTKSFTEVMLEAYLAGKEAKENTTKQYWLFGGIFYYASGGAYDLITTSDNIDDLKNEIEIRSRENETNKDFDWWQIFDAEIEDIIEQSKGQAYT